MNELCCGTMSKNNVVVCWLLAIVADEVMIRSTDLFGQLGFNLGIHQKFGYRNILDENSPKVHFWFEKLYVNEPAWFKQEAVTAQACTDGPFS